MKALIGLEDGTYFEGASFGAPGERDGELVFNTSMTGYQEILMDPSYRGQIVTMTYPLIGNYGINREDVESSRPWVEGFVVRECCKTPSNWRSEMSLPEFLQQRGIIGIEGVDTRALTKHLRTRGAMRAVISTQDLDPESLVEKAIKSPGLIGRDLVKEVSCSEPYQWTAEPQAEKKLFRVAAMDYGCKYNILRSLASRGCEVTVFPAFATARDVLDLNPDGVFLSNGPGDPEGVPYAIETVRELMGKRPIFGICLGHQLLGLAMGGKTFKLKFGHRGANQPVKNMMSGRVEITAQNHGFCVDIKALDKDDVELTHVNLNDNTLEGMRHRRLPIFSVQYHPEASPGPHDARYLFDEFVELMRRG